MLGMCRWITHSYKDHPADKGRATCLAAPDPNLILKNSQCAKMGSRRQTESNPGCPRKDRFGSLLHFRCPLTPAQSSCRVCQLDEKSYQKHTRKVLTAYRHDVLSDKILVFWGNTSLPLPGQMLQKNHNRSCEGIRGYFLGILAKWKWDTFYTGYINQITQTFGIPTQNQSQFTKWD